MSDAPGQTWLAGADGCRSGWVAAFVQPIGEEARVRIVPRFADVLDAPEAPAVVAVDMPIGLPDRIGPDGRGPERAIRPLLGARQSSVAALAGSEPPRKVSKQLFMIAPKIREVDAVLRADASRAGRVYEVHPELAFWRLNGGRALDQPKKVKGVCYEPGLALRRGLLLAAGVPTSVVMSAPPNGAGADDLLDALACAAIARRLHLGTAQPFPDPPVRDGHGLPVAIWA
jgi:predicted RNase H-like nuclease